MRNPKDQLKTETSHCSKQARVDGTTADMDFSAERLREYVRNTETEYKMFAEKEIQIQTSQTGEVYERFQGFHV